MWTVSLVEIRKSISNFIATFKIKTFRAAQRKMYVKPIKNLYQEFWTVSSRLCSLIPHLSSTSHFMSNHQRKKKKESGLCILCFNMHCSHEKIRTYRILKKLLIFSYAISYLECERKKRQTHK